MIKVIAHAITPKTNHYSRHDNFVATMHFEDGSAATLTYTALGTHKYPKEQMEVYVDGKVLVMNDYKSLNIVGAATKGIQSKTMDKGQLQELEQFAKAIKQGGEWAIPLWQQVQAMEIAFEVEIKINEQ